MIFFTADTHFCHSNIIGSCGRPFKNVGEMNKTLTDNWNKRINNNDEVYILGDFLYKGTGREANLILARLNGRKYLVKGNHEKYLDDPAFKPGAFEWVKEYHVLNYERTEIIILQIVIFRC